MDNEQRKSFKLLFPLLLKTLRGVIVFEFRSNGAFSLNSFLVSLHSVNQLTPSVSESDFFSDARSLLKK